MKDRILYFAYGSNMAAERLRTRVPSAKLVGVAKLIRYTLKFHKPSKKDRSGKCDASFSGNAQDKVLGALYSIQSNDLPALDRAEGCGYGYERRTVSVILASGPSFDAQTYIATEIDGNLRPLDWYKEHVLRGARAIGLPPGYITSLEAVVADIDLNNERRACELAIYA